MALTSASLCTFSTLSSEKEATGPGSLPRPVTSTTWCQQSNHTHVWGGTATVTVLGVLRIRDGLQVLDGVNPFRVESEHMGFPRS